MKEKIKNLMGKNWLIKYGIRLLPFNIAFSFIIIPMWSTVFGFIVIPLFWVLNAPLYFVSLILIAMGLYKETLGKTKILSLFLIVVILWGVYNYQSYLRISLRVNFGFSLEKLLAIKTKNENFCKIIVIPDIKNLCYKELAISEKDLNICDRIKSSWRKDKCYLELCDQFPRASYYYSECYHELAKRKRNFSFCEKIYVDTYGWEGKNECHKDVIKIINDEEKRF